MSIFRAISFVALLTLAHTLTFAIDISDKRSAKQLNSLAVTTSDVILIQTRSHGTAVVQFTKLNIETASYRWRYRPSSSGRVSNGAGDLAESYDRERMPDGSYRVTQKTGHSTLVKAGDITFEWSAGDKNKGWIYYDPDLATVRLLSVGAFDKKI